MKTTLLKKIREENRMITDARFRDVVLIMDMLRRGQISTSTTNNEVYDRLTDRLVEWSKKITN